MLSSQVKKCRIILSLTLTTENVAGVTEIVLMWSLLEPTYARLCVCLYVKDELLRVKGLYKSLHDEVMPGYSREI